MANQMGVGRPFADFGELRQRMEEMIRQGSLGGEGAWTPSVDVIRKDRFGSFSRSMSVPPGVKAEDIESTTKDGVLEVRIPLPKSEEEKAVEIETKPKTD